ncbi:hypothetical protein FNV43_RR02843 [Rhamnella rubrinervis]|uniref:Bidirectional sugar transporter SWEET n=1 Tax=Rhamnella rubrinervis TaxID=2594499 RepID=A0A8K0HHC1_9ROSA|nr:hypothetical protein FNV43_RR02843 [Rhamnella rubrinervis]
MAFFLTQQQLAFVFGLLGNIVSFMVFLSPIPTFYTIYKKKTSEGFQSIPYVIGLLSASLMLYYGSLKTNALLIISINSIGCTIQVTYLTLYLIFAPKKEKLFTFKLIGLFNIATYGLVLVVTIFLFKGPDRANAVGWICAVFNLAVFAAPLSIMRRVVKTKSVEFMPFSLSFFLTLCAITWFFYGMFVEDFFIAFPNVLGFLFGIAQMILYLVYKNSNKNSDLKLKVKNLEMSSSTDHHNPKSHPFDHKHRRRSTEVIFIPQHETA